MYYTLYTQSLYNIESPDVLSYYLQERERCMLRYVRERIIELACDEPFAAVSYGTCRPRPCIYDCWTSASVSISGRKIVSGKLWLQGCFIARPDISNVANFFSFGAVHGKKTRLHDFFSICTNPESICIENKPRLSSTCSKTTTSSNLLTFQ